MVISYDVMLLLRFLRLVGVHSITFLGASSRKLKQKFIKKTPIREDKDSLAVEEVSSDDEWRTDPCDNVEANSSDGGLGDEPEYRF
ncbi:hypothetical protein L2E82_48150 [Cichorium intybus]|uniref:Uncharacterized protein n=1 Tax=Cichorium intybus TaxID=13427 RepID=A0ACB8Z1M9_CICIN|nr:hypothetical protein L2E82_48150 [Cichorium intybus]